MTDSEYHDRQAVAFPVGDLTRRLLRRAAGPIGVIDVHHAAELHSRSNLWLGQRLELLDNLKKRYGLDRVASPVAGVTPFIAPLQRMAASIPFDLASVSPLISRTDIPETVVTTGAKASSVPSPPTTPQYRVKRPNSHTEPNPRKILPSEMGSAQSLAAGEIQVSTNPAQSVLQRKTSETPSPVGSELEAVLQPSAGISKTEISVLPLVRAAAVDTPRHVDIKLVPTHMGSLSRGLLPRVGELRTAIATQVHLQRMPDPASTPEDLPGADESTLSRPAGSELYLQRNLDHPPAFPAANSVRTAETVTALANTDPQFHSAVSAEIRLAPALLGSTSIVWRKADNNGPSRETATPSPALSVGPTYTNWPEIMREAASEPVSSVGSVAPAPTPISGNSGADVMSIAEQVSRIIARQLRVESERRGRTK